VLGRFDLEMLPVPNAWRFLHGEGNVLLR
jgi:hypothetical protein